MANCAICKINESAFVRELDGLKVCPKCLYEILMSGLTRDVELRNEAVEVGQTCPTCMGRKKIYQWAWWTRCPQCKGTGHV
jgi:DnaJ-class molecular chaperone